MHISSRKSVENLPGCLGTTLRTLGQYIPPLNLFQFV